MRAFRWLSTTNIGTTLKNKFQQIDRKGQFVILGSAVGFLLGIDEAMKKVKFRMKYPILGMLLGGTGAAIPPLGVSFVLFYMMSEDSFMDKLD